MNLLSSISQKIIMGITGIILLIFVIGHLIGNLSIYAGSNFFNTYAEFIQSKTVILWLTRSFLLFCFLSHILLSICLTRKNRIARPIGYNNQNFNKATFASRTMIISGSMVLMFLIFHIAHLTIGFICPEFCNIIDNAKRHDVYSMTVLSFQNFWISIIYIVAQIFLAMHISHAFSSAIQTFGLNRHKFSKLTRISSILLAILIFFLYISIPISVLLGVISI